MNTKKIYNALVGVALSALIASPILAQGTPKNRAALAAEVTSQLASGQSGGITALQVRTVLYDVIASDFNALTDFTPEPALGNPGTNGFLLSSLTNGTRSWIAPSGGGGGGLTSFTSGNATGLFTTALGGSPTTSPALTFSLSTTSANYIWAGPTLGGSGTPSYRLLVAADLPLATTGAAGAVIPDGSTVTVSSGTISVPTATSSTKGIVKPDNATITVNGSGVISVPVATNSTLGSVRPDGSTITVNGSGVISTAGSSQFIGSTLYVDQRMGSDSTGNGSVINPFASIAPAIAVIVADKANLSSTHSYAIQVGPGFYNETVAMTPYTVLMGQGSDGHSLTSIANVNNNPIWEGIGGLYFDGAFFGFVNVTIQNSFSFQPVRVINPFLFADNSFFDNWTIQCGGNGGQMTFRNCVMNDLGVTELMDLNVFIGCEFNVLSLETGNHGRSPVAQFYSCAWHNQVTNEYGIKGTAGTALDTATVYLANCRIPDEEWTGPYNVYSDISSLPNGLGGTTSSPFFVVTSPSTFTVTSPGVGITLKTSTSGGTLAINALNIITASGPTTQNLPASPILFAHCKIKNQAAGTVTVQAGSSIIYNTSGSLVSSFTLANGATQELTWDGTYWNE
jgi:hypothetical protein